MGLKAASKRIIISDESVNSQGFWTLTDGIDLSLYDANPILLHMHDRTRPPIGVVRELKKENTKLTGLPFFDENDPYAVMLADKYENGMLNMASAGLQPLEVSTKKEHYKGKAPCLTKSLLAEISLVDIGSNRGALKVSLYNAEGSLLQLSTADDLVKLCLNKQEQILDMIQLKDVAVLLKLAENADAVAILDAVKKLQTDNITLAAAKTKAEDDLKKLKEDTANARLVTLVKKAVDDKKITAAQEAHFIKLGETDYETVEKLLGSMAAYESVEAQLKDGNKELNAVELTELLKLSGDELFSAGKFDRLKQLSEPHFKIKYKEAFGKEPEADKK